MTRAGRALCAAMLLLWIGTEGCTAMREIPPGEYAAVGERKNVRLMTREGLHYELDFIRVQGDTVIGYRRRDQDGPIDEYATVQVALDDVESLSTRSIDWKRTTLVGGSLTAVLAVVGIRAGLVGGSDQSGVGPGGGKVD
jgi:hypothetical protein